MISNRVSHGSSDVVVAFGWGSDRRLLRIPTVDGGNSIVPVPVHISQTASPALDHEKRPAPPHCGHALRRVRPCWFARRCRIGPSSSSSSLALFSQLPSSSPSSSSSLTWVSFQSIMPPWLRFAKKYTDTKKPMLRICSKIEPKLVNNPGFFCRQYALPIPPYRSAKTGFATQSIRCSGSVFTGLNLARIGALGVTKAPASRISKKEAITHTHSQEHPDKEERSRMVYQKPKRLELGERLSVFLLFSVNFSVFLQ